MIVRIAHRVQLTTDGRKAYLEAMAAGVATHVREIADIADLIEADKTWGRNQTAPS